MTARSHLTAAVPFMMVREGAIKLFPRAKITADCPSITFIEASLLVSQKMNNSLPKVYRENRLHLHEIEI